MGESVGDSVGVRFGITVVAVVRFVVVSLLFESSVVSVEAVDIVEEAFRLLSSSSCSIIHC